MSNLGFIAVKGNVPTLETGEDGSKEVFSAAVKLSVDAPQPLVLPTGAAEGEDAEKKGLIG